MYAARLPGLIGRVISIQSKVACMLLVVGTSGHVGTAILKTLAGTPYRLRALLRNPDQPVPPAANIEIAVGELAELSTVQRALEGVDTAFLASSFDAS